MAEPRVVKRPPSGAGDESGGGGGGGTPTVLDTLRMLGGGENSNSNNNQGAQRQFKPPEKSPAQAGLTQEAKAQPAEKEKRGNNRMAAEGAAAAKPKAEASQKKTAGQGQTSFLQPQKEPAMASSQVHALSPAPSAEMKNDVALATPTFSMPSPMYPPGISYLDLTSPPELLPTKLPEPVTLAPNGNVRNLGKFTRSGKKRENTSSRLFTITGDLSLPPAFVIDSESPAKRPRTGRDLTRHLKSPISKEAMLPQSTPPFRPQKSDPSDDEESEEDDDEEEDEKIVVSENRTAAPRPASSSSSSSKQVVGNGSGSSCHQCKSRCSLQSLILCKSLPSQRGKGKRQGCRKKYCARCLNKFYNESAPTPEQKPKWVCPACRNICKCAACRRQKAKHQKAALTGAVVKPS